MLGALLDRERELAEIGRLIEAAWEGSGGLVAAAFAADAFAIAASRSQADG